MWYNIIRWVLLTIKLYLRRLITWRRLIFLVGKSSVRSLACWQFLGWLARLCSSLYTDWVLSAIWWRTSFPPFLFWLTRWLFCSTVPKPGVGALSFCPSLCCPFGWTMSFWWELRSGKTVLYCALGVSSLLLVCWRFWVLLLSAISLLLRKTRKTKNVTCDTRLPGGKCSPVFLFIWKIRIILFYMNKMVRIREVFFYGQNIKWNWKTKKSRKYLL